MDGKKLYTGDILAASLNKAVSLGKFDSGKSGQMNFQITVPAALDNTYALREGDVKWIFSVEDDQQKQLTETPRTSTALAEAEHQEKKRAEFIIMKLLTLQEKQNL